MPHIVALIGNPNAGKSSLFNQLTGLRQKIGNFPGVTVDKKIGFCRLHEQEVQVLDLPGTYSLYPNSLDEQVVLEVLTNPSNPDYPSVAVVVVDASNLKRNLLLFEQISDLGIPAVLALNMLDVANEQGIEIDSGKLAKNMGVPVVEQNARQGIGIDGLKLAVFKQLQEQKTHANTSFDFMHEHKNLWKEISPILGTNNPYLAALYASQHGKMQELLPQKREKIEELVKKYDFHADLFQSKETIQRYTDITQNLEGVLRTNALNEETISQKIDKILVHRVWGYAIFLSILFLIFQSVFTLAQYPMDWIDSGMAQLTHFLKQHLPESKLSDLLTDGLLAGIGGVVIFIPQIALLFGFIALLEESGYMARVVVLMDRVVRRFGLSGKSVVPLISSLACAVPAIMSARTIGNWKDRLITIMVTPLMSCSARLPIYTILIALVVPSEKSLGIVSMQGIALMALYLLGFLMALVVAYILKVLLKTSEKSYFIMELPTYKAPRWNQVGYTILEKVKTFVLEAGKVIVAISIILWVLSSYGPSNKIEQAEAQIQAQYANEPSEIKEQKMATARLENSYAGHFGKFIEPAIAPLGYDWKIGIALITSFAAREVFVGTISTIYSIGADEESTIKERLKNEINPKTGKPVFSLATSYSLLLFYVFAMMCMSTLAITYRETKGWKWALIQLLYMSFLAYGSAWLAYQALS